MPPVFIQIPTVAASFGALFLGSSLSCIPFGLFLAQVYKYFNKYPYDRTAYKLLILTMVILQTADQAFIMHASYHYCIENFDNFVVLLVGKIPASLILQVALGNAVGTIVKMCFCMRVWRFSKHNIPVTGILFLLICAQFGLALVYVIQGMQDPMFVQVVQLKTVALCALGFGVGTDIMTAVALCYYLRRFKTGHSPSDSLVNHLTRYAVNTGVLTSGVSLATLLTYQFRPTDMIFMAEYFVLSKFYAISLLATLNTRKIVRGKGTDYHSHTNTNTNTATVEITSFSQQTGSLLPLQQASRPEIPKFPVYNTRTEWSYPPKTIPLSSSYGSERTLAQQGYAYAM